MEKFNTNFPHNTMQNIQIQAAEKIIWMSLVIFEVWRISHKTLYMNIRFNKNYLSQVSQTPNGVEKCFTRTTICM